MREETQQSIGPIFHALATSAALGALCEAASNAAAYNVPPNFSQEVLFTPVIPAR